MTSNTTLSQSIRITLSCLALLGSSQLAISSSSVHLTYHWHLHQPIYWPAMNPFAPQSERYQFAADSISLKVSNTGNYYPGSTFKHPRNALVSGDGGEFDSVFDKADRVNAYQFGGRDSLNTILSHPDGGASVSYSGALQENVGSLGRANSYGYAGNWNSGYLQARGSSATYRTTGGHPRADMVGMTYHHSFSPLLPKSVLRKEIQIFKELWWKSWNGRSDKSDHSRGFWPIECAFSRHMIPLLVEEGYEWTIVANSHIARTCTNYLEIAQRGNSGWNIDPPNRADQLGPSVPANQWWSGTLDGRGGAFPAPFAYQAHRTKYVDPDTGLESSITIVPMCDLLSYQNGFSSMGTGDIDAHIAPFNDTNQPSIVLMAHDGDNAWGGGSSYYQSSVPDLFNEAASKGYRPTTIQQFLADHPVPASDVVHLEDGAWVNAANDWGHPQFINWLWPPTRSPSDAAYNSNDPRTWFDIENGWTEDWRNWAVVIAGANYCETAEQIAVDSGGTVQPNRIQEPVQPNGTSNNPNDAEQAWHFYLGGLDSGFMYYGTSLDDEVKQTLAVNRAIQFATNIIGDASMDQTPPTVFKPQRFPWNPGGKGWGPLTGYKAVGFDGQPAYSADFYIWTHVFDVSGVTNVTLYIREDVDGVNPLANNDNETYAGGSGVGAWTTLAMTQRAVPTGNVNNDPNVNFFLLPTAIADHFWAKVVGHTNVLLDYYIEATDSRGNTHRSEIQHVWVDEGGSDPGSGGDPRVSVAPDPPVSGNPVTIRYDASAGPISSANPVHLHLGWNDWATVVTPDPPMTFNVTSNLWEYTTTAPATATQLDCVFNNGSGVWDNNAGQDWHFTVTGGGPPPTNHPPFAMDGALDFSSYQWSSNSITLSVALRGTELYVATQSTGNNGPEDHFLFVTDELLPGATAAAPWAKSGQTGVATSKPFVGAESQNDYAGWFNAPLGSTVAKSSSAAGVLEAVIDLGTAFGSVPDVIYLAAAAYDTADGGSLQALSPTGDGPHIEPSEFLAVPTAALSDRNADGLYDRLDPALDFRLTNVRREGDTLVVDWNAMPGRQYELIESDSSQAHWTLLSGVLATAGTLEVELSRTNTLPPANSQRYYRVRLLP
jgi:hypothetical protein